MIQKTGDRRQDKRDRRWETGDRRWRFGDGRCTDRKKSAKIEVSTNIYSWGGVKLIYHFNDI